MADTTLTSRLLSSRALDIILSIIVNAAVFCVLYFVIAYILNTAVECD